MRPAALGPTIFSITLTDDKLQQDPVDTKEEANQVAYRMGKIVRGAMQEAGSRMIKNIPKADRSIQEVEHDERLRLAREAKARQQPSLFELAEPIEPEEQ